MPPVIRSKGEYILTPFWAIAVSSIHNSFHRVKSKRFSLNKYFFYSTSIQEFTNANLHY